jgi:hypothetical protein
VVDVGLIPGGNVDGFIIAVNEQAAKNKLLKPGQRPKFVFLVENEQQLRHQAFANPDVVGLLAKPVEPRHLSFVVATALQTKFSIYSFPNLGWASVLLPIHVARDVQLENLSEFGASLRLPRPIAPGTLLFLRGDIFDNAPNRCLAARFYHCEEHTKETGQFLCSVTYFGLNDSFLKYARKWFRENYAASKQAAGGEG